jgi:sec-independent protein translocase protein TatB
MPDVLFILLLALVIFGPKKLPEIARQLGKLMAQFRMASNDLKRQLESEMLKIELEEKEKKAAGSLKQLEAADQPRTEIRPQSPLP